MEDKDDLQNMKGFYFVVGFKKIFLEALSLIYDFFSLVINHYKHSHDFFSLELLLHLNLAIFLIDFITTLVLDSN